METFELEKSILNTFWGDSGYLLLFYVSLFVIFLLEKDKIRRQTWFWYPVLVYAALINPVSMAVGKYVWREAVAYFCRQFTLIPIFFTIAYAGMLILEKEEGKKKLIMVAILSLMIITLGRYTYNSGSFPYYKSDNFYKIPEELIKICDYVSMQDGDAVIATPGEFSHLVRQYDPSIHMLTATRDETSTLPSNLASDEPDVALVMQTACANGGEYVVARDSEKAREAYAALGYEPKFITDNYAVYACYGYPGHTKEYNEKDEVVAISYYDAEGKPMVTSGGYAAVRYTYDERGRKASEIFYDVQDEPVLFSGDYSGMAYEYDSEDRVTKITYTNGEGIPVMRRDVLYASVGYEYDKDDNRTAELYYNRSNVLCRTSEKLSGWRKKYIKIDERFYVTRTEWIGTNGLPVMRQDGYAITTNDYNDKGYVTRTDYFDDQEKPVNLPAKYASILYERDDRGNATKVTYLNKYGWAFVMANGYAKISYVYDAKNRAVEEYYYDAKDNPVRLGMQQEGVKREYNDANKVTRLMYVDHTGAPVVTPRLYSTEVYGYDANGNMLTVRYYGTKDEPILCDGGYFGYNNEFDEKNRLTKVTYYDTLGNVCMNTSGYAVLVRTYDESGAAQDIRYNANGEQL